MKKIAILANIAIVILVLSLLFTGCQKEDGSSFENEHDPFTTTWSMGDSGRTISVSGYTAGHSPGEESEFLLRLNNYSTGMNENWQDEYRIFLVDMNGVVTEITSEQFNVPGGLETQKTFFVEFPEDYEGAIGLCISIPQRGSSVTTLWIGDEKNMPEEPWPSFYTCP